MHNLNPILLQHWEPWSAQLAGMCFEHNSSERDHKGVGQRLEDQDMARRDGVSDRNTIREHPDGECEELH